MSLCRIFFFKQPASPRLYTLSLHDALPIFLLRDDCGRGRGAPVSAGDVRCAHRTSPADTGADRKSTRLNSSHITISYAVFCLKKKNYMVRSIRVSKTDTLSDTLINITRQA